MTLEEDALTEYLVEYLEADTTLMAMLNGEVAPEVFQDSTASPFVRIDRLSGDDLHVVGLHRVWVDSLWHIRLMRCARSRTVTSSSVPMLKISPTADGVSASIITPRTTSETEEKQRVCWPSPNTSIGAPRSARSIMFGITMP